MKWFLIGVMLILSSCQTATPHRPTEKAKKPEYVKTDVADVEEAKATIESNKISRAELIKRGTERAERFEPLILSLIAYHEYSQPLTLADVSPFIAELPKIASISTYSEKEDFIRLGTSSALSAKKIASEADKGRASNEYVKELETRVSELELEKKEEITGKTLILGTSFLIAGGIAFAASFFTTLNFMAGISSGVRKMGVSLMLVGKTIIAFGIFTDALKEFLKDWGDVAIGVPALIFVSCLLYSKIRKTKIDVDEYEEDANLD